MKTISKKKKLLLVCDTHAHIIKNNLEILSNLFNVDIYCSILYKKKIPSEIKKNIYFFKYPVGLVYFFLIFKSFNYDFVFLTNGPQNINRKTGLIVLLFYLIFVIFHGKKTIMGIMDIKKYSKIININIIDTIQNFIRNKSISKLKLVFFETRTLLENFKKNNNKYSSKFYVNYPLHVNQINKTKKIINPNLIKIGILGSVSSKRKDYKLLADALNKIDISKKIKILLLGEIKDQKSFNIIKKLKKFTDVEYQNGYISHDKFKELSLSCDFLVSPLKKGYGGAYKGSGSFFDAISAKKMLLVPYHADPQFEFKNFCKYYKNSKDLKRLIERFVTKNNKIIGQDNFKKYNNLKIKSELIKYSKV